MTKQTNFWEKNIQKNAVLDPTDRISEVLFGLIMVLTFTGSISGTEETRPEIKHLLKAALQCNIAWGLIDAIMYLMNILIARGHSLKVVTQIRLAKNKEEARAIARDELQPVVSSLLKDEEVDHFVKRLAEHPLPTKKNLLNLKDFYSAFQIFLLVFLCTFPVALPFAFMTDIEFALKLSNVIALLLLFIGGYKLAQFGGFRPIITGIIYAIIGACMVFLTLDLGG